MFEDVFAELFNIKFAPTDQAERKRQTFPSRLISHEAIRLSRSSPEVNNAHVDGEPPENRLPPPPDEPSGVL